MNWQGGIKSIECKDDGTGKLSDLDDIDSCNKVEKEVQ